MKNSNLGEGTKIKKWIDLFIVTLTIYAAVMATMNFLNIPRIGYINTTILLEKYKDAIEAREKIRKQTEEWQNHIRTLEKELSQINQDIINKNDELDRKNQESKKEVLTSKQNEIIRYSQAVNEKAFKLEQDLMKPVFNSLNTHINNFGKEVGYDMIFGTLSGGNILYARHHKDLTMDILEYISNKE